MTAKITEQQAKELLNFGPAIDDATVEEMEKGAASNERGQERRCVLIAYARSCEDLSRLAADERQAFDEMLTAIESFSEHAAALKEIADSALVRMRLAEIRATPEG